MMWSALMEGQGFLRIIDVLFEYAVPRQPQFSQPRIWSVRSFSSVSNRYTWL
jgi:hypothetical protein